MDMWLLSDWNSHDVVQRLDIIDLKMHGGKGIVARMYGWDKPQVEHERGCDYAPFKYIEHEC
jgi:hypothetical protein